MTFAQIRHVTDGDDQYDAILIWCPGCEITDEDGGLHMLSINGDGNRHPVWTWNGDLEAVGLEPSILTHMDRGEKFVCHSFLRNGQWQFLGDCTHSLVNQTVPMVPLPDWVVAERSACPRCQASGSYATVTLDPQGRGVCPGCGWAWQRGDLGQMIHVEAA